MTEKIQISIVVPVYRIKEEFLRQCIETLVHQTLRSIEIILIDDGSPDNCGRICDEYAGEDKRICVIHQENMGVSVARNAGIDAASGEYVMFVDADDWLELDCCERILAAMEKENCEVLLFRRCYEEEKTVFDEPRDSGLLTDEDMQKLRLYALSSLDYAGLKIGMALVPSCRLIPRGLLNQHQCRFQPGIKRGQDNVFNLYLYEIVSRIYYLNYVGYHYRKWEASIGNRYNEGMPENDKSLLRAIDRFISRYHENEDTYYRAMGMRCFVLFTDVERCLLFHRESKLTKKECICIMKEYMEDDTVKKYINACKSSDFRILRHKIRFLLWQREWFGLYYSIAKAFYRVKA